MGSDDLGGRSSVLGSRFIMQGSGLRAYGSGFRVRGPRFKAWSLGQGLKLGAKGIVRIEGMRGSVDPDATAENRAPVGESASQQDPVGRV